MIACCSCLIPRRPAPPERSFVGTSLAMSVLPVSNRSMARGGHFPDAASMFSPQQTRGLFGSQMSRPQAVQWSLRSGASSPRSVQFTTFSPRTTSAFDRSFHRAANKFSLNFDSGAPSPRDTATAQSHSHQRFCWQASRLSVTTPQRGHRPATPFSTFYEPVGEPARTWPLAGTSYWQHRRRPQSSSRTIDFWQ